jgi:hypothetical protein
MGTANSAKLKNSQQIPPFGRTDSEVNYSEIQRKYKMIFI